MSAYKSNRVAPWAVVSQKVIICSSDGVGVDDIDEGAVQLNAFLSLMRKSGTEGACELHVYKLSEDEEIDSSSKYFRAFRFSLFENAYAGSSNSDNRLLEELKRMNDRIQDLENGEAVVVGEGGVMDKLGAVAMGLVDHPMVQQALAGMAVNIMNKIVPMATQPRAEKVAGLKQPGDLSDDQKGKIQSAVTRLAVVDPQIGDHLLKLAHLAETDIDKYTWGLKLL